MSIHDLTNNKIRDTYYKLLQITSSDFIIRDGVGDPVTSASLQGVFEASTLKLLSTQITSSANKYIVLDGDTIKYTTASAETASYAISASYVDTSISASYSLSSSYSVTSSYTETASVYTDGNILATQNWSTGSFVDRKFIQGSFKEKFNAIVTSDGSTVSMSLEQAGGGDLTMQFNDGDFILDTTPSQSIGLSYGTEASPQVNYAFVSASNKIVTINTTGWPAGEHIKIGYFLVQDVVHVSSSGGPFINQNWNDFMAGPDNQGHMLHITKRIRLGGAQYFSGIDPNGDGGTYLVITPSDVRWKSTSGIIFQLHEHAIEAKDTSDGNVDDLHIVNESGSSYKTILNMFDITKDSTGTTITNNKYFNLVIWGVANKSNTHDCIMVNLPGGFYNGQSSAEQDINGYDNFSMPRQFDLDSSTGYLITRLTIKMGATWTLASSVDLRGTTPETVKGGNPAGALINFPDNQFTVFNNADNTKILTFDASTIGTGNTRTFSAPDIDGTLALEAMSGSFSATQDVIAGNSSAYGVIIKSPDGTSWRLSVNDAGAVSASSI